MFLGQVKGNFLGTSALPLVGTLYSHCLENSLKEASINTSTQLVGGDPVVALVTQANQSTSQLEGFNPDSQVITAKASTVSGGAGTTDACGFLVVNSNDRVQTGGVGIPQNGQRVIYAPLGQGAIIWLEVAEANIPEMQTKNDANVGVTIDAANGGVKVASSTDTPLQGAKLISGLTQAKKINVTNGIGELVDCYAVAVQLL